MGGGAFRIGVAKRGRVFRRIMPRVRSRPSSKAQAVTAFKSGMLCSLKASGFSYTKVSQGTKTTLILTALSGADNGQALLACVDAFSSTGNLFKAGIRDFKTTLFMKNVSTYQLRLRVTTWICRREIQVNPAAGNPYISLQALYATGFIPPFANTMSGFNENLDYGISNTIFQNPLWIHHFKAIKVKNYTLMPYRSRRERIHCLRRRPGLVDKWQNTQDTYDPFNWKGKMAVHNTGGLTTVIKTIEIVGEIVNDATMAPAPTIFTSPGVLLLQQQTELEAAASQPYAALFTAGDPAISEPTVALTGQPWNYMFPAPSSSSSVGTSCVIGALTSGL